MKVTFLFWFCYNDESIVLETAVLSDDWGQSLCGWMDIECSNEQLAIALSTTISGSTSDREQVARGHYWNPRLY